MALLTWTPLLEVGIPEVDADHRALIELLNRVHAASDGTDCEKALALLRELERYTAAHFAREEKLMAAVDYEFSTRHREEHCRLFSAVQSHIEDLCAGRIVAASIALFVQGWLLRHIATSYRDLGETIADRKVVR